MSTIDVELRDMSPNSVTIGPIPLALRPGLLEEERKRNAVPDDFWFLGKIFNFINTCRNHLNIALNDQHGTVVGKFLTMFILLHIVVSTAILIIHSVASYAQRDVLLFFCVECYFTALFTLEFLLRLIAAPHFLDFIFSYMTIIDLAAFLPFYIELLLTSYYSISFNLKILRVIRVIQLVRIFRLSHSFNQALKLVTTVLESSKQVLLTCFLFICFAIMVSSTAMFYCERGNFDYKKQNWMNCKGDVCKPSFFQSIVDAFWWCCATFSTVGYGDMYPTTMCGRVINCFTIVCGVIAVALPISIISSNFTNVITERQKQREKEYLRQKFNGRVQCHVRIGYHRTTLLIDENANILTMAKKIAIITGIEIDKICTPDNFEIQPHECVSAFEDNWVAHFEALPKDTGDQVFISRNYKKSFDLFRNSSLDIRRDTQHIIKKDQ